MPNNFIKWLNVWTGLKLKKLVMLFYNNISYFPNVNTFVFVYISQLFQNTNINIWNCAKTLIINL